jgi:hypothetical protein
MGKQPHDLGDDVAIKTKTEAIADLYFLSVPFRADGRPRRSQAPETLIWL